MLSAPSNPKPQKNSSQEPSATPPPDQLHLFVQKFRSIDDHESLFGRLTRYTRFVLFGKWALGLGAIILLLALIIWPLIGTNSGTRVSFISSVGNQGGDAADAPRMISPRYQSVDEKLRQYTITATQAVQKNKDLITLENINSELLFANQSWLIIEANTGNFIESSGMLQLQGNVLLNHADGYRFTTDHADIDVNEATAAGNGPVKGTGPTGNLLATGFKIRNNGDYMFFGNEGRVHVTITQEQQAQVTQRK